MFEHLLVPLDGSKPAEAALPFACKLALKCKASITLLHIIESDAPAEVHGFPHLQNPEDAELYLKTVKAALIDKQPELHARKILLHVHEDKQENIAQSIVEHSREVPIDMVILTHHGVEGFRERTIGSIAQQVIGLGKKPILLIHPDRRNTHSLAFKKICIPLDNEKDHAESLPYGQIFAKYFSSEIYLVSVIPTFGTMSLEESAAGRFLPASSSLLLDVEESKQMDYLEKLRDENFQSTDSIKLKILRGDPERTILRYIQKNQIDLTILSSHGKAGWAAFWDGSFASKIITSSTRPMLIIPV